VFCFVIIEGNVVQVNKQMSPIVAELVN